MISLLGFLIMLAPLVIVHELGHFLFAKLFNVKAEAFSIGFGPKLWAKKIGETEWKVSLIPLGGYVKLLGEDGQTPLSPEDKPRALQNQAPYKRFFIFFGGPLFNFLWAILVYMAIMLIGEPELANQIGRVIPGSAAEKIGFVAEDRVLSVDGQKIQKYEELAKAIDAKPEQPVVFQVQRKNLMTGEMKTLDITATPTRQKGFSIYGEETHVGEIEGLLPNGRAATVGVSNMDTLAGKALMRTGDKIETINNIKVKSFEELETVYAAIAPNTQIQIGFFAQADENKPKLLTFTKSANGAGFGADAGFYSSEVFIEQAMKATPAEAAGLKKGDRIVSVDTTPVTHFFGLREAVQKAGEAKGELVMNWERDGKMMSAHIKPTATNSRDALLNKQTQFTIGVIPQANFSEPEMIIEREWNPFLLVAKGTERMVTFTYRNFVSIKKMITGEVSTSTLGGPILIGKIAGESLSRGLIAFLSTMAILSIGLGVLNILPVPVLDGGHILLLGIEVIRKRPLSMKQLEIAQTVGLSIIGLLMIVVFKNDIMRLPFFN